MKQTHRAKAMRIVAFILTVILSIALCISLAACNNGNQPNTPNPPQNNNNNNNNNNYPETQEPETPDGNEDNKDNDEDPNEQEQPGEQQQPGGQEQPDEQPEEQDISREEFEEELEAKILEGYNTGKPSYAHIQGVEILTINKNSENSAIYYIADYRGTPELGVANVKNDAFKGTTYKEILNNLNDIEYPKFSSRITEQGVPEDICAFALSQQRVQDFLYANGVNSSDLIDYKVINTTKFSWSKVEPYYFYGESWGRTMYIDYCHTSDVTLIVGNKIFTVRIGSITEGFNTQREYLTEIQYDTAYFGKDIYGVDYLSISYMTICDYEELSLHQETVNN